LVPEDRKSEGLLLPRSVRDNLTLPVLGRISTAGVVRPSAERALVTSMVDLLRIKTTQPSLTEVGNLSGGNQQKVMLGRWILADCDVLLLFDVTRGVDVATKHEIYDLIVDLARKGKGILLYSSDTEEVAHLCHRVLVLREGRVAAELDAEAEARTSSRPPTATPRASGDATRRRRRSRSAGRPVAARPVTGWCRTRPLVLSFVILAITLSAWIFFYYGELGRFPDSFDVTQVTNSSLPLVFAALGQSFVVLTRGPGPVGRRHDQPVDGVTRR
jgi:ABC-type glutathione transport system ATPase component